MVSPMEQLLQQMCRMGVEINQFRIKALDARRFWEADQLGFLDEKLYDLYQCIKAGYREDQLRVPPGRPDGGQWTEIGVIPGNENVQLVMTILPPSGKRLNRANIFIGGGGDRDLSGGIVRNSSSIKKNTYGDNYYTTHDMSDEIIDIVESLPKGRQVNLIGHSWGGDTAVLVAERLPERIHTMITIDPVSHSISLIMKLYVKIQNAGLTLMQLVKAHQMVIFGHLWVVHGMMLQKSTRTFTYVLLLYMSDSIQ